MNWHKAKPRLSVLWPLCLFLLGLLPPSRLQAAAPVPDRDIVYSARYYSRGPEITHYHLWRINSDGTGRTQITSGTNDDDSPIWLPDGKTIFFIRRGEGTNTFCTVQKEGGPVIQLTNFHADFVWPHGLAPDRHAMGIRTGIGQKESLSIFDFQARKSSSLGSNWRILWSPDSQKVFVQALSPAKSYILNLASGASFTISNEYQGVTWLDSQTLVAEVSQSGAVYPQLAIVRADGIIERSLRVRFAAPQEWSNFADDLYAIPGDPATILYARHAGNSSAGSAQAFYRLSLQSGAAVFIAQGRDLAWSPDHQFFCTGTGRDLAALNPVSSVWVSSLWIVSLQTGQSRKLVGGLVSVGEFDWRPAR